MKTSNKIRIVATGDYCPTESIQAKLQITKRPEDFFGGAVELFRSADLSITNLEYPLTFSNNRIRKYGSHQKGNPLSAEILKSAGISLVNLANNHIYDYGEAGLLDTLSTCEKSGLRTVGAGRNLNEAQRIFYMDVHGVTIAVIAICENEYSIATERHGGANPMDLIDNIRQIQEAKQKADIVLLSIHGGNEFSHYPSPWIVKQYRFYASLGVTAIIGHHPHYIQGYEMFGMTPIIYSLGKLMYTRMADPSVLEVPIAILEFNTNTFTMIVDYQFYKISAETSRLESLNKHEEENLRERFGNYCAVLQEPKELEQEWKKYCFGREIDYLVILTRVPRLIFRLLRRLGIIRWIIPHMRKKMEKLLDVQNIIQCESHRDAALFIFENIRHKNVSI